MEGPLLAGFSQVEDKPLIKTNPRDRRTRALQCFSIIETGAAGAGEILNKSLIGLLKSGTIPPKSYHGQSTRAARLPLHCLIL
ncbi:hypothetical protein [Synechococcus sp. M16CYN]|uniref:hypothetical protein n=1 Tax=Synechococcus sp. M16CYN TaxID=3103139 RepID=UPI00333E9942